MYSHPIILLGLGLCLGPLTHTQEGVLPKPSLRAEPGPVIPRGRPVTFVCQGPAEAKFFFLEKDGIPIPPNQISASQDGSQGTEGRFHIPAVRADTAGHYLCLYEHVDGFSNLSEPLQLQVTEEDDSTPLSGALPKPSLKAEPGPVIPRGRPVTFVCSSLAGANSFHLEKDGILSHQISVPQDGFQGREARFHIPAVREDNAGRYQCRYTHVYGWSELSEPLQLQVTAEDITTEFSGPASRDYTVENIIQLALAGVVLLALVVILVEAGLSQRKAPQGPQE